MAKFLITDAGLAALVNAQQNGTLPLVFETVQFGSGKYTPTAGQTSLQSSFKTLSTIAGGAVGDNVIHITVSDVSDDTYEVYEVGVFTDGGVLFAVYSQDTPIIAKAAGSQALLAVDIVVTDAADTDITVAGDTSFTNPPATTQTAGVVRLATASETELGTSSSTAVTPAALKARLEKSGSLNGDAFQDGSIGFNKLVEKPVSTVHQALSEQEQQQARENIGLTTVGATQLVIASSPQWYKRPSLPTTAKTSVTIPANTQVNIGNEGYISTTDITLQLSTVGTASARAGKDVYIYACKPGSGTEPVFVLSLNSTVPTGYSAENSRKIGGFHCLCVSSGTISGNAASGYAQGDAIPTSVWDLLHRAQSENEGMVYIEELNLWVDIYLPSWSGSKLQSAYGGTIVDGYSSMPMHGERFVEYSGYVKKRLLSRDEYVVMADSGNQMTSISGSTDPGTTGGHVDTAGRRILTKDFVEDCAGVLWQWTRDIFGAFNLAATATSYQYGGASTVEQTESTEGDHWISGCGWMNDGRSTNNINVDGAMHVKGDSYGAFGRVLVGGDWDDGSHCGSRSVLVGGLSSSRYSDRSARCGSSPRVVNL